MRIINENVEMLYKAKKLLIVVDMLNGFIKEGPMANKSIISIVPKQIEVIHKALSSEDTAIIFVSDRHILNAIEFQRFPVHCLQNSWESMVIDELKFFQKDAITYSKNSTNLIYVLERDLQQMKHLENICLIGCLTDICIYDGAYALRTYFDEYNRNIRVGVYKEAIATYDSVNHPKDKVTIDTLELMRMKGIEIYENI